MVKRNKTDYLCILTSYILTIVGTLGIMVPFLTGYRQNISLSVPAIVVFTIVVCAVFTFLYMSVRKKWIVVVGSFLLVGFFVLFNRYAVAGGVCEYIDKGFIDNISYRFDIEAWYIDVTGRLYRDANITMTVYVVIFVLCNVICLCIADRETSYVPAILFFVMSVYIAVVSEVINYPMLIARVVFCISLVIVSTAAGSKDKGKLLITQIAAAASGIVMGIAAFIALCVTPDSKYVHSDWFQDTYDKAINGELTIGKIVEYFTDKFGDEALPSDTITPGDNNIPSAIGGGNLGNLDEISFSGEQVASVIMPNMSGRYYIKGFVGRDYSSTRWSSDNIGTTEAIRNGNVFTGEYVDYMIMEGIRLNVMLSMASSSLLVSPSDSVTFYPLDSIQMSGEGKLSDTSSVLYVGRMKIDYTGPRVSNGFIPLYTLKNNQTFSPKGDIGWDKVSSDAWFDYAYISDSVLPYIDKYIESYSRDTELEEAYRKYVYFNYRTVNTPIAEQLKEQWGGADYTSGYERFLLAVQIRRYLSEHYTYTTKPGKVPDGYDFLDYFLNESKEGYCTYFATAAVMMFRSAGVPARYVEGYVFDNSDYTSSSISDSTNIKYYSYSNGGSEKRAVNNCYVSIKDSNAHAWVEYYVDGVGWIDWEVTPGYSMDIDPDDFPSEFPSEESSPDEENTTTEKTDDASTPDESDEDPATTESSSSDDSTTSPTDSPDNEDPSKDDGEPTCEESPEKGVTVDFGKIFRNIGRALAFLMIPGILVLAVFCIRAYILNRKRRIYGQAMKGNARPGIEYLHDIYLKMFESVGIKCEPHVSEKRFAAYVCKNVDGIDSGLINRISNMYERVEFSAEDPNETDFITMREDVLKVYEFLSSRKKIPLRMIHCIRFKIMI